MNIERSVFGLKDFADSFGVPPAEIPVECKRLIESLDFSYQIAQPVERDEIILDVLKRSDSDRQVIGAPGRQAVWQKGWEENLSEFVQSGHDLSTLTPKFIRAGLPIRLNGSYVRPTSATFELDFVRVFRIWLFKKYFWDVPAVYEFGCGTGFNLAAMAQIFPEKRYVGLDFVRSATDLVDAIGKRYGWRMEGRSFDFRNPDYSLSLEDGGAVLTFGALEQVAGQFDEFLGYLLKQPIRLCVNVEPTIELYDDKSLFDYLAIRFHEKRGYSRNYLNRLRELEEQGKVTIEKVKRLNFGSLLMEGYTYMVWRPR